MIRAVHSQKTSDLLENSYFSYVFDFFPLFYAQERITPVTLCSFTLFIEQLARFATVALPKRADHDRFAQVAHDKRPTMSNLLRLLMTKE